MTLPAPVVSFLAAVAARDADAVAACFADDAVYAYAVPHPPLSGLDTIRAMFADLLGACEQARWDVVTSTVDGERVWLERVDRFWFDGREVAIECAGVVELSGDRIQAIRDYVDLQTWQARRNAS